MLCIIKNQDQDLSLTLTRKLYPNHASLGHGWAARSGCCRKVKMKNIDSGHFASLHFLQTILADVSHFSIKAVCGGFLCSCSRRCDVPGSDVRRGRCVAPFSCAPRGASVREESLIKVNEKKPGSHPYNTAGLKYFNSFTLAWKG